MMGRDGLIRSVQVEADSLYDAAEKGRLEWIRLWFFDPDANVTVQSGDELWLVTPAQVHARSERQRRVATMDAVSPST
jgi:hypothetical protein